MTKRPIVLVLMGVMGCGKTTIGRLLADKLGCSFYEGDDFHSKENVEKMRAGDALTDKDRLPWLEKIHDKIQECLRRKENAVFTCSALKRSYREILGVDQKKVRMVYLKGNYELLRGRVEKRQHPYMDKALLKSQLETLEEPQGDVVVNICLTPEVIVETIIKLYN